MAIWQGVEVVFMMSVTLYVVLRLTEAERTFK